MYLKIFKFNNAKISRAGSLKRITGNLCIFSAVFILYSILSCESTKPLIKYHTGPNIVQCFFMKTTVYYIFQTIKHTFFFNKYCIKLNCVLSSKDQSIHCEVEARKNLFSPQYNKKLRINDF